MKYLFIFLFSILLFVTHVLSQKLNSNITSIDANQRRVVKKLGPSSATRVLTEPCLSGYYGFPQNEFPSDTTINIHHKDAIGAWFVVPMDGTIDTVLWQMGDSIGCFRPGAANGTLNARIFQSFIGPLAGPGIGTFTNPPVNWGYYVNTNDAENNIAAFYEDATPQEQSSWVSTNTPPTGTDGVPSFPPFGKAIWGLAGYPVNPVRPDTIMKVVMNDLTPLSVHAGDLIFISLRVPSSIAIEDNDTAVEFRASKASESSISNHTWIFTEHEMDSAVGWHAMAGINWNVWYSMTPTSNSPPNIFGFDHLTQSSITKPQTFNAYIRDCNVSDPNSAGVASAGFMYSLLGGALHQIPLTNDSADRWSVTLPSFEAPMIQYFVRAWDSSGLYSESPLQTLGSFTNGIAGEVFVDIKRNGIDDISNPLLAGQKIYVSGTVNVTATTNSDGSYAITLPPGDYDVSLDTSNGWKQSFPNPASPYHLHLDPPASILGVDFGAKDYGHNEVEFIDKIIVEDHGGLIDTLIFGGLKGATDQIDSQFGEKELPFIPPPGAFDVRWQIINTLGSKIDVRDMLQTGHLQNKYIGRVQPGDGGYPMILSWDPHSMPIGSIIMQDTLTHGGLYKLDMTVDSLVSIPSTSWSSFEIIHTVVPNSVSGTIYLDKNGNGLRDLSEVGLVGWNVNLIGPSLSSTTTDNNGRYSFNGIGPGTYSVQIVNQNNWMQTSNSPSPFQIQNGGTKSGLDIGVFKLGEISGEVFSDQNINAIQDNDDSLLTGWKVYLQGTTLDSVVSDANGNFMFINLQKGSYSITQENRLGWTQDYPAISNTGYSFSIDTSGAKINNVVFGSVFTQPLEYVKQISINDNENNIDTLMFGTRLWATDGLDTALGEFELPQKPIQGTFDTRWNIPSTTGTKLNLHQVFTPNHIENVYQFSFQPSNVVSDAITIRWDSSSFNDGNQWILQDDSTQGHVYKVDMHSIDSLIVNNQAVRSLEIVNIANRKLWFDFDAQWNIVSIPVNVATKKSIFFPMAISEAYTYTDRYIISDTMEPGIGYWIKFPTKEHVLFDGLAAIQDTINVRIGWNMIGSITVPILTNTIIAIPDGIIAGHFFGYSNGYTMSDTLFPGRGYWIKMNAPGEIILSSSPNSTMNKQSTPENLQSYERLIFTDPKGDIRTLYYADESKRDVSPQQDYDFPPVPPDGVFDVRYSNNQFLENFGRATDKNIPICISSAKYPITIGWTQRSNTKDVFLQVNGKLLPLDKNGKITITDATAVIKLVLVTYAAELPKDYALAQAYPNPFNPTTTIQYQLPSDNHVSLNVYNLLGQVVATLVNQTEQAGYKQVNWNASSFASGIYFYRLDATNVANPSKTFTSVRKMILMK